MIRRATPLVLILVLAVGVSSISRAEVEWVVEKTLAVGETPLDVVSSVDGQRTFVLTEGGTVLVYSAEGNLEDTILTGEAVDGIEVSPRGDRIYLLNRKSKAVKIVSLDFIRQIDEAGSPIKGPADAPVAVAVFSDFQ